MRSFIAISFVLLAALPVRAQTLLPSPIAIDQVVIVPIDGAYWNCISFRNVSDLPITSIRFAFAQIDVFGETRGRTLGERTGTFSPGIPIEGATPNAVNERTKRNCWPQGIGSFALAKIGVSVVSATFAGGGLWQSAQPDGALVAESEVNYAGLGLPDDMQRIGIRRGRPCQVSVVGSPQGSLDVWAYACGEPGAATTRRDDYFFLNGRLVKHVAG
ncbi:MAG: hypothetical protein JO199_04425 [Candidatus Eremiobacteraeota bacterium]|nr:hypothetical protein [Candidatus Eremiobacteraeota bacterium]